MRIKNRWFRAELPRGPRDIAGGVAFIAWRVAQQALKNMRLAAFEIEPGPLYFAFLAEWLIFLSQIADRLAYARMSAEDRVEFTGTLANRLGEILQENQTALLGDGGLEVGSFKGRFISLLNQRAEDYAAHDYRDAGTESGPDYGFLRNLAQALVLVVGEADRVWVHDQVMEIEAPEAASTLRRGVLGLLGEEPRPARRSGGVSGD